MRSNNPNGPPGWACWILSRLCRDMDRLSLLDDLEIEYLDHAENWGRGFAAVWYVLHLLRALPELLYNQCLWRSAMIRNYIKMAIRNIKKQKGFSFINIFGLSIGLALSYIILLYVIHERSYDSFHENKDRLYRILVQTGRSPEMIAMSPFYLAQAVLDEFPDVEKAVRVSKHEVLVRSEGQFIRESNLARADADFFGVFSYSLRHGDRETVLRDPYSIVLSESMALKYFGDSNPLGRTVSLRMKRGTMFDANVYDLTVTGVMEDFPSNSHLHLDFLIPMSTISWGYEDIDRRRAIPYYENWGTLAFQTYLLLDEAAVPESIGTRLGALMESHTKSAFSIRSTDFDFELQPVTRIHLNRRQILQELEPQGSPMRVTVFSIVAACILLIAVINYGILSTARSAMRAGEVGVRKVMGAGKGELVGQVLFESGMITLAAFPLAAGLVVSAVPHLYRFLGTAIDTIHFIQWRCIVGFFCIVLLASALSGAYIGIVLSAYRPIDVIRDRIQTGKSKSHFRRALVVVQLTIFVILMTGAMVIGRQADFMAHGKDLGFERKNILSIVIHERDFTSSYTAFKEEVSLSPDIEVVTCSQAVPPASMTRLNAVQKHVDSRTGKAWFGSWEPSTDEPDEGIEIFEGTSVDIGYVEALGLKLVQGRTFQEELLSDRKAILVNETFIREKMIEDPVGREIQFFDERLKIIGVLKDYHSRSLYHKILPLVLRWDVRWAQQIIVRIRHGRTQEALAYLKTEWGKFCPNSPFEYSFLDDHLENLYMEENRFGEMMGIFTLLAIVVAGLGLFGLSQFTAQQKTHEIGIRKVVGASAGKITRMMLREFILVVLAANAISWPIAWYLTRLWLQHFAFRVDVNLTLFLWAGAISMVITISTVFLQVFKSARVNPVEALRYE